MPRKNIEKGESQRANDADKRQRNAGG